MKASFSPALVLALAATATAQPLSSTPDSAVPQTDGVVNAVVQSGSRVYVGGYFTTIGGVARNNLAAFDSSTGVVDAAWDPDVSATVSAIAVSGGKVYVGGGFLRVNGTTTRQGLAAFDVADGSDDGTADAYWDPDLGYMKYAKCLVVAGGKLYVGGSFVSVNGGTVTRRMLAAFELANDSNTGAVDPSWDPGADNVVHALAVTATRAYAGGAFGSVNNFTVSRNGLAAFDLSTGGVDTAWNPNLGNACLALAVSGGKVHAGGVFTTVNGSTTRNRLAAFDEADGSDTGTADTYWDPDMGDDVNALLIQGGKVYAGGRFTSVSGGATARNRLAGFNPADGSSAATPDSWDPNAGNTVQCLAPSGTGFFAGGYFTTIGGNTRRHLAGFGSSVPVELSAFRVE